MEPLGGVWDLVEQGGYGSCAHGHDEPAVLGGEFDQLLERNALSLIRTRD